MFGSQSLKRLGLGTLGSLLLALAAAAPAGAAWSSAFVSPSSLTTNVSEPPTLATDADGDSFHVWRRNDNVIQGRARMADKLGSTLTLSKVGISLPEVDLPTVAANSRGDALFAWLTTNTTKTRWLVQGRYRAADGTLGPLRNLVSTSTLDGEVVAIDVALAADGDGIVMYMQETLNDGARVFARTRSATGTMGQTKGISAAGLNSEVFDPEVAMDNGGEAVFVWQQDSPTVEGKIQARVLSPTGALGSTKTLAPADAMLTGDEGEGEYSQLAVNPRGDAAFTWGRELITTGKTVIEGRVLTDDDVLKKTVRLSAGDSEVSESEVDIANDGAAAFSWGQKDLVTGKFRAMGRALSAANALGQTKVLSGPANDVSNGNVGVDADGDTLFVWEDQNATTGKPMIQSRVLTAAGALRPPVTVLNDQSEPEDLEVAVAARGDAAVSWLNKSVNRVQAGFGP